jgi:type I restriction enzyme S subunit
LKDKAIIIKPDTKKVNEKEYQKYKKDLGENTILVSINGTLGNVAYYNNEPVMLGKSACYFNLMSNDLKDYIYIVLNSPFFLEYALSAATGTTIKNVSLQAMNNLLVPFPSLPEQNRILNKIELLKVSLDRYYKQEKQLSKLNNSIRQTLKKSVLQEAIQGKLVPQDASEEPATILLQHIREEKLRLVKEGKLKKKDVIDSTIFRGDDNRYYEQIDGTTVQVESDYDFPSTWEVVRLAHICRLIDGEKKEGQYVCLDAKYLRGKSTGDFLNKGKFVTKDDNIILVDGENSGEVFTVPHDGYMGSTFKQLWVSETMHLPYVLYFIQFYKDLLRNSKKGAAIPHLNKEIFYSLLIGIPPYKEQIRIADKINIIFSEIKG